MKDIKLTQLLNNLMRDNIYMKKLKDYNLIETILILT